MTKRGFIFLLCLLALGIACLYVFKTENTPHPISRQNPNGKIAHLQPDSIDYKSNREVISEDQLLAIQHALPAGPFVDRLNTLSSEARNRVLTKIWRSPAITNNLSEIRIGELGDLHYSCKGMCKHKRLSKQKLQRTVTKKNQDLANKYNQTVPVSSPPQLNSRPNSQNTIFLDFNGMFISNTAWNFDYGVSSWDTRAFSRDGDEDTFSPLEQEEIEIIWRSVAAKFEAFDVNVTTEEPAPNTYYYHALITHPFDKNNQITPLEWAAGIAYLLDPYVSLSSYTREEVRYYSPAWVDGDIYMSAEDIADTCAHELGHNFGLNHDGTTTDSYYEGHDGNPSWGPIMGAPWDRNVTSWSKGEYAGANNTLEDDVAIIAHQFSYLNDEVGSQLATATSLNSLSDGSLNYEGVIERQSDIDVFEVKLLNAGQIDINVYPSTNALYGISDEYWRSMLKLEMQVFDDQGALLSSGQITNRLHAGVTLSLAAGTYYIKLEGVGTGTPLASTPSGFTDYGSIGAYYLSGNISAPDDLDGDGMPDFWEIAEFGSVSASPSDDPDGDGSDNFSEYIAGTDPNDEYSTFSIAAFWVDELGSHLIWNPVEGRSYRVQLSTVPTTNTFSPISETLNYPINRFTDTVERAESSLFYRLEVDMP